MPTNLQGPVPHAPRSSAKTRPVSRGRSCPPADPASSRRPRSVDEPTASGRPADTDPGIREAIDAALGGLTALEHHTHDVARAFRDARVAEARADLATLVETTGTMLRLAVVTAEACGGNLDEICRREGLAIDVETRRTVDRLIDHQLRESWTDLADVLDEEFVGVLGQWRAVFAALAPSDGPEPERAA